tara:strand:+ start:75 stop:374 length:300 start_codon:yes stop_codon:yes gene_type:complete
MDTANSEFELQLQDLGIKQDKLRQRAINLNIQRQRVTALHKKSKRLMKLRIKQDKFIKENQALMIKDKEEKQREAAKLTKSDSKHGHLHASHDGCDFHE